jgi:tRNA pseudouridine38-40 synthase
VEATVDEALQRVMRLDAPPRLTVAGRTDAGVHARGQVAHTDVPASAWAESHGQLITRLRGVLPGDVRVTAVTLAPEHFDARFAAIRRRYAYRICDLPGGVDPPRRRDVLQHLRPLDVSAMNQAGQGLVGEHDFASFCKKREGASTIRRLIEFRWSHTSDGGVGHELAVAHVVAEGET